MNTFIRKLKTPFALFKLKAGGQLILSGLFLLMLFNMSLSNAQSGAALNFTRTVPGDNVVLPSAICTSLSASNKITVEAWVRPTSFATSGCIIGNYTTPNNNLQFLLRVNSSQFQFYVGNSVNYVGVNSLNTPTLNAWQHVAGVWDGTVAAIYLNGVLSNTLSVGYSSMGVTANSLIIGGNSINENFEGDIDEVRIWDVARTQCQINTFMNCEISGAATGLLANYHFNQGIAAGANSTVTALSDDSGNNYTGNLVGFDLNGAASNWVSPGGVVSGSVTPLPPPNITAATGTINSGQSFTIIPGGAATYSFLPSGPVVSPTANTSYTIIGSAANTCTSSVTTTVSIQGAALNFISPNAYVNLGTAITNSINGTNKITVEAWVYPTQLNPPDYESIIGNYSTPANSIQFLLRKTGNTFVFYVGNGTTILTQLIATATPTLNAWQHVAGTWDGSTARIYVNGVLSGSVAVSYPNFGTSTNNVWIGGNTAGGGEYFKGSIDEVRIWNRALCVTEIQNNMNAEIPTTANGLLANYHFNQGIAAGANATNTTLIDAAGSTTGTLTNFVLTGTTSNWISPGGLVSGSSAPVYAIPNITVNSGTICGGSSFTMNPSGASSYTFQGGNAVVTPGSTTSYSIIGTTLLGCVTNSIVSSVTVNAAPSVSVNSGAICNGRSFTITPSGATSYTVSGNNFTVSPTANASYSITGTSAAGCISSNTAISSVTVNALPSVSVNTGSICAGNLFTLVPSGASTYTISGNNFTVSPATNTSYSVTGTSTAGCVSSNTAVSTVSVNALPVLSVNSGSFCSGNSFTIIPSGASTYTVSGNNFTVSPATNTSYSVTGTSTAGCVNTIAVVSSVTVNSLPIILANSGTICTGETFTIVPSGANTYTISGNNATVSPVANTSYSVTGTSIQGCVSSNTAVSSVVVNTLPVVSVNSGSICAGNSFTLIPSGANTYTISGGNAVVSPASTSSYSVTGTSTNGCISSNTAVSSVSVQTLPVITVNSGSICAGNSFTLIPSGANTYTISGGNTVVSPASTSSYSVQGTSSVGCVSGISAISTVSVKALPSVSVTGESALMCSGESVTLTASGAVNYSWDTNGNTPSIIISPSVTTSYTVTGTSAEGCAKAVTVTQSVSACTGIESVKSPASIGIHVYPNPSSQLLNIELENTYKGSTTLILLNSLGQAVLSEIVYSSPVSLNITELPAGIYILKAENNGSVKAVRIIKN